MVIFCDFLHSVFLFKAILGLDVLGLALSRSLPGCRAQVNARADNGVHSHSYVAYPVPSRRL